MPELNPSSNAIAHLNDIINRGRSDRQRMAKMLGDFNRIHLKVRTDLEKALGEVDRLEKALASSEAEKSRLAKRERELAEEVSMMAAAIQVANREIAESDTMLFDTATAVKADFRIGEAAPAQNAPEARAASQTGPAPHNSTLQPPRQNPRAEAPRAPAARPVAQQPEALLTAAVPDELDESFSEIARSLEISISEMR